MILNDLAKTVHKANARWWIDMQTGEPLARNKGELIALMHSELSEMLEGIRKNKLDDHLPHRLAEEVEAADLLIRLLDYCGGFNLDLHGAFEEKMKYNSTRHDHSSEARLADGGKKF